MASRGRVFLFLASYVVLASSIIGAGSLSYRHQKIFLAERAYTQLSSIADLKVAQFSAWRQEQLGSASGLGRNPVFVRLALDLFKGPSAKTLIPLQQWLEIEREHLGADALVLADLAGRTLVASGKEDSRIALELDGNVPEVVRNGVPVFSDFEQHRSTDAVHMSLIVPIEGTEKRGGRPFAMLVARIDPASTIFPFLERWPGVSPSAETILVERQGDELIFLGMPRKVPGTAFSKRLSLAKTERAEVRAVLIPSGVAAGVDYRGKKVLTGFCAVPGMPWHLLVKIDEREVFSPLHRTSWVVFDFVLALLAVGGIVLWLLWRHQRLTEELERRKLLAAVEQSHSIILITDITGDIEYVNPAFTRVTGYIFEEVRGKNPRFLKSGEYSEAVYRQCWETITGGGEWRGEFHNRKKDGQLYWEMASISPIHDDRGNIVHFLKVAEDITLRKEAEAKLEEYSLNLERMVEERTAQRDRANAELFMSSKLAQMGRMAAGIAHQLNSPIAGGMLYADALLERCARMPEETTIIVKLRHVLEHMKNVVESILAIARVKHRAQAARRELDINGIVERVVELCDHECAANAVRVTKVLAADLPSVSGEVGDIDQVILNLVNNAVDAMEGGGELTVTTSGTGKGVEICIQDNGSGIAPEYRDHIFDPFFTTRSAKKGTGLGLTIVQDIVQRYGGRIAVESEMGKGAAFTVWFPASGMGAMQRT